MTNKTILILLSVFLLINACLPSRKPGATPDTGSATAEQIIRKNAANFSADLVAGRYQAVASAYSTDAKIFPPGGDILQRQAAILEYWTPKPDRKSRTVYHNVMPEEIRITGDYAYDWGYYEGKTRQADGSEVTWRGKYVIVWKLVGPGVWKIYLDCWNRA